MSEPRRSPRKPQPTQRAVEGIQQRRKSPTRKSSQRQQRCSPSPQGETSDQPVDYGLASLFETEGELLELNDEPDTQSPPRSSTRAFSWEASLQPLSPVVESTNYENQLALLSKGNYSRLYSPDIQPTIEQSPQPIPGPSTPQALVLRFSQQPDLHPPTPDTQWRIQTQVTNLYILS